MEVLTVLEISSRIESRERSEERSTGFHKRDVVLS